MAISTRAASRERIDEHTVFEQYCTFFVGDLYLGIAVLSVQEILRFQPMTEVPLAPHVVSGLVNLRGDIVTAIDLRRRLGLRDRSSDEPLPTNVIVRTETGPVSFLVDAIDDVLELDGSSREVPPSTLEESAREIVLGVYKLEGKLLLLLDHELAADVHQEWASSVEPHQDDLRPTGTV